MDKIPTILFYMVLIVVVCVIATLLLSLAFYVLFDRGGSCDFQMEEPIDSIREKKKELGLADE